MKRTLAITLSLIMIFVLTAHILASANETTTTPIVITTTAQLISAIENQKENQEWIIKAGEYDLPFQKWSTTGETEYYFPIKAAGLKITGEGNPTLYSSTLTANAEPNSQALISVQTHNVKISGVTIAGKYRNNKAIHVNGKNFELINSTIMPPNLAGIEHGNDALGLTATAKEWGGEVQLVNNVGNAKIHNVLFINSRISLIDSTEGKLDIDNVIMRTELSPAATADGQIQAWVNKKVDVPAQESKLNVTYSTDKIYPTVTALITAGNGVALLPPGVYDGMIISNTQKLSGAGGTATLKNPLIKAGSNITTELKGFNIIGCITFESAAMLTMTENTINMEKITTPLIQGSPDEVKLTNNTFIGLTKENMNQIADISMLSRIKFDLPITLTPKDVAFKGETNVEIKTDIVGLKIYYTTDGSDPKNSTTKKLYNEKFKITKDTHVRAYISHEVSGTLFEGRAEREYKLESTTDVLKDFTDINSNDWFYKDVEYAVKNGLFKGMSSTSFEPNLNMTRAMLITVLARSNGIETDGGTYWYSKAVDWALENKVSDCERLDSDVTREEVVTMLWRDADKPMNNKPISGNDFTDASDINEWASEAMKWAIENNVVKGYENKTIKPQGSATRAEIAALFHRYLTAD